MGALNIGLLFGSVLVGLYGVRQLAHRVILRGLRAPRVVHDMATFESADPHGWSIRCPAQNQKFLFGWFSPVFDAKAAPAVLVMHGWGANAAMMLASLAPLKSAGFSVLLLDARCHGQSDDEPFTSLPRFAQDIEAGLNWLTQQANVDAARLMVIGHSVGAGAALLCASANPQVRAVVSISAFAHPREVMLRFLAEKHVPFPVLGWYVLRHVQKVIGAHFDAIAPINTIGHVRCPVLLVHGRDDEMVPFEDALRLQAAGLPGRVTLMAVNGQHDPSNALQEELPRVVGFLHQVLQDSQHVVRDSAPG